MKELLFSNERKKYKIKYKKNKILQIILDVLRKSMKINESDYWFFEQISRQVERNNKRNVTDENDEKSRKKVKTKCKYSRERLMI